MTASDASTAACLIRKTGLHETTITNVCNGTASTFPHTAPDYAFAGGLVVLLLILVALIVWIWVRQ